MSIRQQAERLKSELRARGMKVSDSAFGQYAVVIVAKGNRAIVTIDDCPCVTNSAFTIPKPCDGVHVYHELTSEQVNTMLLAVMATPADESSFEDVERIIVTG